METFVREHIKDFVKRLGYSDCYIDSIPVVLNNTMREYRIAGQNEYYFLTTDTVVDGALIIADNSFIIVDALFKATKLWRIQELTGNIIITIPAGTIQVLEFLRVIPQK
jgi:hypothetical protein